MSLRRHILQVVALVTAVALVFGAFAGSATAKKMNKKQKAKVRAELRKQVKKNPGVVKRRAFLKKAALVNFKLPVTIRLRNTCRAANNPTTAGLPVTAPTPNVLAGINCASQGTALNQRTIPNAKVNLGPSLGTRSIALGGALSAVVEFADTYDGGALGNVNLKIIPDSSKGLTTSSVPLLWNNDISKSSTRSDANFAKASFTSLTNPTQGGIGNGPIWNILRSLHGASIGFTNSGLSDTTANTQLQSINDTWGTDNLEQGCGDWVGSAPGVANQTNTLPAALGPVAGNAANGYKRLFYGAPLTFSSTFGLGGGTAGYSIYTTTPSGVADPTQAAFLLGAGGPVPNAYRFNAVTNGGILPVYPGIDNPANIQAGGVVGDNEWIGPNPFPFPTQTAPSTTTSGAAPGTGGGAQNSAGGNPTSGGPADYGNAKDTVLRTNALTLDIAQGGQQVNMSTGTPVSSTAGGLTTAQGSQNITMGYSGGQANLFGNIPGKNVGIDVTVNLATKINSIVRIMDQDVFKQPSLLAGEPYPAGIFNCRQIMTGAVQNYIPGVRLTGNLRIAPAITKDGRVRIAKATVASDANNPDRVALSACLFPAKPYQIYNTSGAGSSSDRTAAGLPTEGGIEAGGTAGVHYVPIQAGNTALALNGNTSLPLVDTRRWTTSSNGTGPSNTRCGTDAATDVSDPNGPGLAEIIRQSGLTGTVSGLPQPGSDVQANGVAYKGDQATVAGDITVDPIDVDVLLGDVRPNPD